MRITSLARRGRSAVRAAGRRAAAARAHAAPPRRPPAQALALGRRVLGGGDAVRGARAHRRRAGDVVGGLGRRAPARAHPAAPRPGADGARARAQAGAARPALRGDRRRRGRLAARRAVHLDPQAGRASRCAAPCSAGPFEGYGFIDDTAGYHARRTAWRWSAGVGIAESGARVAWNLVDGVHDGPERSERTVWVDGTPHHVGPLRVRRRPLRRSGTCAARPSPCAPAASGMLVFASDYEQPFGRFTGSLPVRREPPRGLGCIGTP